jgi:hypothetical protein
VEIENFREFFSKEPERARAATSATRAPLSLQDCQTKTENVVLVYRFRSTRINHSKRTKPDVVDVVVAADVADLPLAPTADFAFDAEAAAAAATTEAAFAS